MEDDAIQKDVSDQTKHDKDYDELVKRREETKAEEEPEVEEELGEKVEDPEMMEFIDSSGEVYQVPVTAAAKLKIDGEDVETPLDQALRRYQKGAAGDKKLQEASELKKTLEAKEQELTQKEQSILSQLKEADEQKKKGDLSPDDHKGVIKDLASALVDVDEDRASESLNKLVEQLRPEKQKPQKSFSSKDVDKRVDRRLANNQRMQMIRDAQNKFQKEYKDLAADEVLFNEVDRKTRELVMQSPESDPWEIIEKAAEQTKKWRDGLTKKPKKTKTPTPASGRASIGEDEKPEPTRDDVINEIKKARGQPV